MRVHICESRSLQGYGKYRIINGTQVHNGARLTWMTLVFWAVTVVCCVLAALLLVTPTGDFNDFTGTSES